MKFLLSLFLVLFFSSINANPAQREDARIEREKILRAADRLEVLLPQIDSLKSEMQSFKTQMDRLQLENATLKKNLSALEASRVKERETILDEVSKILAESHSSKTAIKPSSKPSTNLTSASVTQAPAATTNQITKEQVGYEHVVGAGQTVSSIAKAFNESGIKVTVNDIIKANNLGADAKVRVGQKLFIPKK